MKVHWTKTAEEHLDAIFDIYHIQSDQIDVLAVIHGAMNILHSSKGADD